MEKLVIESTKSTPTIEFDPDANKLWIKGQSYPENAFKFYEPILKWIDAYLEQVRSETTMVIELELPYINTSSTKCFMMLLEKFDEAHRNGKDVHVLWYYNEENENELECAEEFKEDLSLPFDIVPKEADRNGA